MCANKLSSKAARLGMRLQQCGRRLCVAESCTGGWLGREITAIPGCSAWFECGFITYSNAAKEVHLGIPSLLFTRHGAVSVEVARAMAEGALRNSEADVAVAITGIAGPDGGSPGRPVGTVCIAYAGSDLQTISARQQFTGGREEVRVQAVDAALSGLMDFLDSLSG